LKYFPSSHSFWLTAALRLADINSAWLDEHEYCMNFQGGQNANKNANWRSGQRPE
jgi:hypothetical protein